jgi:hypothetical protein
MNNDSTWGGATFSKRYIRKGSFVAEIRTDNGAYRFVIRDQNRTRPSIHGRKKSMQETESEVRAVLNQLTSLERAA